MTLAELVTTLERRATEAERMQAHAPVSVVLRDVLADLRVVDGTAAAPTLMPDAPDEERYLTPEQVEKMLALPKGYAYDHKQQLGGVKVCKYLRFPESALRRRLERTR